MFQCVLLNNNLLIPILLSLRCLLIELGHGTLICTVAALQLRREDPRPLVSPRETRQILFVGSLPGGDSVVPSPRNTAGMQILFNCCGHLEHWLHLCRNGRMGLNSLFNEQGGCSCNGKWGRRDKTQNICDTVVLPCAGVCIMESPP